MRMQYLVCVGMLIAAAAGCSHVDPTREEFVVRTPDGITLRGAILPAKCDTGPLGAPPVTVVYSHPWLMTRDFGASMIEEIRERGWQVVVYDQRGHGQSTMAKSTFGAMESKDLAHLIETLQKRKKISETIYVMGISLGGSTSLTYAATHPSCKGVLACVPVDGLPGAMHQMYPMASSAQAKKIARETAYRNGFTLAETTPSKVGRRARCPLVIVVAEQDMVVPQTQTDMIYYNWGGPKRRYNKMGTHMSILYGRDGWYADRLEEVMRMAGRKKR